MDERHPLGDIVNLWYYPVKSLAARPLLDARVGPDGFEGDRKSALFVETPGHVREGRTYRGKENNRLHTVGTLPRARDLASERHVEIAARDDGPHFDAEPVSVLFSSWVAELEAMVGMSLDPLRFRANVYVLAAPDFEASETALVGTTLHAAGIALDVLSPIYRCVTITYDVETGAADPRVHRATAMQRDNIMGVYCTVRQPGTMAVGDTLWVG